MVPGETKPLFFEDRYEKPAKDGKKAKECRFRHVVHGVELTDTGPRRILYGLPHLVKASLNTPVFITEGAAKCDPLIAAGLLAVAAPYHTFKDECATATRSAAIRGSHFAAPSVMKTGVFNPAFTSCGNP